MGPSCSKRSAVFAECHVEKYGMTLEVTESMLGGERVVLYKDQGVSKAL